jgi:hypothetical protein
MNPTALALWLNSCIRIQPESPFMPWPTDANCCAKKC